MNTIELDLAALYSLVPDNATLDMEWREDALVLSVIPNDKMVGMAVWLPLEEIYRFHFGAQFFVKSQTQILVDAVFPKHGKTIEFTVPTTPTP